MTGIYSGRAQVVAGSTARVLYEHYRFQDYDQGGGGSFIFHGIQVCLLMEFHANFE